MRWPPLVYNQVTMRAHTPSMPAAPQPGSIGFLRGEFVDAALEKAFRQSALTQVVPQQQVSLLVWAALLLLFAVPDYLAMGPVPDFWLLAVYRGATAVALLVARVCVVGQVAW